MNISNSETFKNGLSVSVDWISFTLHGSTDPADALSLLGFQNDEFNLLPSGRYGYRSCLKSQSQNIFVLYDGSEGMGVHVDVSGSAILEILEHYYKKRSRSTPFGSVAYEADSMQASVLSDLFREILSQGKFSRLDLAIDDFGAHFFSLPELYDIFDKCNYVSRFKGWSCTIGRELSEITGYTIYMGSRSSDCMLRIYDKQLEQNKKHFGRNELLVKDPWVRWELELKDDFATRAARFLADDIPLGEVVVGILSNYIRLIVPDSTRKCRCSNLPKWEEFIANVVRLSLYQKGELKTINHSYEWLKKQVSPTLAAVFEAYGGDAQLFLDLVIDGRRRLNRRQKQMILSYRINRKI